MIPERVIIWICEDCGSYYASSGVGDLREQFNKDMKGDKTFSRARCPTVSCAVRGTMRIPIVFNTKELSTNGSETEEEESPHWLGKSCLICGKQLIIVNDYVVCSGCGANNRVNG